jgi:lysophospholipase L1-like esterase
MKTSLPLSRGSLAFFAALLIASVLELGCSSAPGPASSGTGGDTSGDAGTTGSAGASGTAGTTGSGGGAGAAGTNGAAGTGTAGTTGMAGAGGATGTAGVGGGGATGTAGAGGAAGRGGTTGAAGAGGAAGRGGTTGTAGAGGAAGRGGTTGIAGAGGAAGRGGTTGTAGAGGTGGRTTNLRVTLLGDSTTASTCYRSILWQLLTNSGRTRFDFIGSRSGDPGCSFNGYDRDNEGHGGYIVTDILKATSTGRPPGADSSDPFDASAKDLATWFDGRPSDVVLMHFGTNDVWNNIAPAMILNAYTAILTKMRSINPNVRVMVAQITPLNPSGCSACVSRVMALNAMIPGWATQNNTAQSPVTVVDQYTNFNTATDTGDGVHANPAGSMKIAMNWFNALIPIY